MKNRLLPALCIALAFAACTHKKGIVTTFAGTGIPGNADGDKSEATFSNLMGVAADSAGNVFIADSRNNVIRKIDADGSVTTIAGSGRQGSADGKGTAASFFFPGGIAMGPGGALYVADTQNSLVRRIAPDGTVSTLAGRSNPQIDKRRDTVAKINRLYGIVADPNGNVYISDWERDQVKKIAPNGKISVVAGSGNKGAKDGKADSASFYLPEGLTLDKQGNLYVADTYNNMIRGAWHKGLV
jgi:sugar lactone lactonase YvrE